MYHCWLQSRRFCKRKEIISGTVASIASHPSKDGLLHQSYTVLLQLITTYASHTPCKNGYIIQACPSMPPHCPLFTVSGPRHRHRTLYKPCMIYAFGFRYTHKDEKSFVDPLQPEHSITSLLFSEECANWKQSKPNSSSDEHHLRTLISLLLNYAWSFHAFK